MASGRFLSTSIAEDDRLSKLSLTAEFIYLKTIPHLDRDGMISGKPGLLYSRVCPTREEMFGNLQLLIDEWVQVGLVMRFDSPEGPVLFFPGFLKNNTLPHYDRERASRFPVPPGYERTPTGLIVEGTEPPAKKQKSKTPSNESSAKVQDEVLELVLDIDQDEVLENDLQEQEEDQDQDQEGDEEEDAREAVHAAWLAWYREPITAKVEKRIDDLTAECGPDAVIHGIASSVAAKARNFKYIAECARNYIPPAPANANGYASYHVDTYPYGGDHACLPDTDEVQPAIHPLTHMPYSPAPPLPRPADDPWAIVLAELARELPSGFVPTLEGSTCEAVGMVERENGTDVPLYRVLISPLRAANGLNHFTKQAGVAIRRKLGTVLGHPVQVDIVAAEPEQEAQIGS